MKKDDVPPRPPPPPPVYPIDKRTNDQMASAFTYHPPDARAVPAGGRAPQVDRYNYLRDTAGRLGNDVARLCPPSRERSLALTKLEEAVMWANAAIARHE